MKITFTRAGDAADSYEIRADGVHVGYATKIPGDRAWIGRTVHESPTGRAPRTHETEPTRGACAESVIDRYTAPRAA